jgi:hypothetical protein
MALTRDEVYNAIVRAKCGLSDIYLELVKARAQGSKAATDLRKKAATLFAYISALENVLDCDPPPTSTSNPSAPICDLDALFVGKCYTPDPDVLGTGFLNLVVLAGSSSVPYQDYYYTYERSANPLGPWLPLNSEHGNMFLDQLLGSTDSFLRITVECTQGGTSRQIITETKTNDSVVDYNTFGYITPASTGVTSIINEDVYVLASDTITISNLNTELIISSIVNINTSAILAANGNSFTFPISGNVADGEQLAISFTYLPTTLACSFTRLITVHVVPYPVIAKTPAVLCPGDNITLSVTGYVFDTYLWSTGETTPTIDVTTAGTYACLVTVGTLTGLIDYEVIENATGLPDPYFAFLDGTPVPDNFTSCNNDSILVQIKDNVYTTGYPVGSLVKISGADPAVDPNTFSDNINAMSSPLFMGLSLPSSPCVTITPSLNVRSLTVGARFVATNVSCNGLSDGELNIDLYSSEPYTDYIITLLDTDGVTVIGTYNALAPTIPILGLPAGTYTYNHDYTLYGVSCTTLGDAVTITEPAAIVVDSVTSTNVTCNGLVDGAIYVAAHGGVGGLTYQLNDSAGQPTGSFIGIKPDVYVITITDGNGCTINAGTVTITEPAVLDITAAVTACYEVLNPGVITYSGFTGGSGTLTTLQLYDVSFNLIEDVSSSLPLAVYDFINLPVGDYIIYAQDTAGCTYQSNPLTIIPC